MCINSVKEICFYQKYQKWIYQVLEMSSIITYNPDISKAGQEHIYSCLVM